jgi:glycerate kinase
MAQKKIILGWVGSATNDGGVGLMQALGVKFLDDKRQDVSPGGGNLQSIENIDTKFLDPRLADIKFEVACDVTNPLTGKEGASAVFGPQKGADSEMVKRLDQNLTHLASMIKQTIHEDISNIKGSGAAGGIGGAMVAFLNSELKSGIEIVLDLLNIDRHLSNADFVITGEGRFDKQSLKGKAPIGIVKRAAQYDCDVYILAGSVEKSVLEPESLGIKKIINISPINVTHDIALKFAYKNLVDASSKLAKIAINN